jgi:hypothetical protein
MPRITATIVLRDDDRKRRVRLAGMADRAAIPERPVLGRGPRYLIHPRVSFYCEPELSEIARGLRDETLPINTELLDQLATFLKGPDSSLHGLSEDDAVDEGERLAHALRQRRTVSSFPERERT